MGGDWDSPVDMEKSLLGKTVIYDDTKAFSEQMPATRFFDLTITYRIHKSHHSSVWALQIKNVLGSPMYEGYSYYYKTGTIENKGVAIVLPIFSYKIEF
jgi:hypothetical protein